MAAYGIDGPRRELARRVAVAPAAADVRELRQVRVRAGLDEGRRAARPALVDARVQRPLARVVDEVLGDTRSTVVCTHRPVLPALCDALGLEHPGLELGEMLVVHLRKNKVAGIERHLPRWVKASEACSRDRRLTVRQS